MQEKKGFCDVFKLIYMKADYEPWWQFEGWEAFVEEELLFETEQALDEALHEKLRSFRSKYEHEQQKEARFFAFWSEDEREYCEACDDESQIFHGLIIIKPISVAIDRK